MKTSLKLAGAGVALLGVAAFTASYFQITGGRVKTCGADEIVYCGIFQSYECRLKVEVKNCSAGGSGISVNNDDLHMCSSRRIVWKLTTDGYKFADDGIDFKDSGADFDGKMKSDDKFVWRNKHTHPADDTEDPVKWPYKIHILKSNGDECATLDPRVYNE